MEHAKDPASSSTSLPSTSVASDPLFSLFKTSGHLPTEIILLILIHLDHQTLLAAASTCRRWRTLANRYRQHIWRHLAWRDYSFTAARGLWKLEFFKDRDLQLSFPLSAASWSEEKESRSSRSKGKAKHDGSKEQHLLKEMEKVTLNGARSTSDSRVQLMATSQQNNEITEITDGVNHCFCTPPRDHKDKQCAGGSNVRATEGPNMLDSINSNNIENEDDEALGSKGREQDWKALYQLTSNWYKGRAKGYCPLMLPSLTSLAMVTQILSDATSSSSSSVGSISSSAHNLSTPAQRTIQRILKRRKPLTVVGLQHEGSAQTSLTLASYPKDELDPNGGETTDKTATSSRRTRTRQVTLIRSNPHYRIKRSSAAQISSQLLSGTSNALSQLHLAGFDAQGNLQKPNIIAQNPLEHDQVVFAIRSASIPEDSIDGDNSVENENGQGAATGAAGGTIEQQQQQQQALQDPPQSPIGPPISSNPANDILCHYSSPLHSFLVTGHMDGSVMLWDMSIKEPGQQCIRYWETGARRRVLCVGMNSRVVVCGNANSTLCVWDIHPENSSSIASHGMIHVASYLSSTAPPGLEDWTSGIEHICVGDSLVACSTEFSGSVLVFSLATGSMVYEIPGLYQPSKMCMTDFFLLTGGRGTWNQGGSLGGRHQQQQHGYQYNIMGQHTNRPVDTGHDDDDPTGQYEGQNESTTEEDEYMSCCVNVWDLKTGKRLYSLIPRLPAQYLQQTWNNSSILGNPQSSEKKYNPDVDPSDRHTFSSTRSPGISVIQQNGTTSSTNTWYQPNAIFGDNNPNVSPAGSTTRFDFVGSGRQLSGSIRSTTSPSATRQSPASAPLTLTDIAVTPDHSTLVVTLCERYGEGREGVYCWDFSGSRLEGYHEQGNEVSTMILDKTDIEYGGGNGCDLDNDAQSSGDLLGENQSQVMRGELEENDNERYSNDRFNNNMVMQQVDSTVLRDLHQARITGKVWIGWKLDEDEFANCKAAYKKMTLAKSEGQKSKLQPVAT
ncbi:hypothetical protein BGZ80_006101 [Entomortierella chlamydospora]|uniref:F-box domain-containing protein n=1 Tax=Entomortierella chlamydospora TaxID=101097 RepID=A0A9P6N5P0_9FUNG|nr:hypothetical protein BGZ79_000861 [Entomortierella chlamydospora]KAG0024092.1 hypothetical protein BGZ80_006101 [Entomortierella chlamydospora]